MADGDLSSDLEQVPSPPRIPSPKPAKKKRGKSHAVGQPQLPGPSQPATAIPGVDKAALCRHNALERQFNRAQRQVQSGRCPSFSQSAVAQQSVIDALATQETDNVTWSQNNLTFGPQDQPELAVQEGFDQQGHTQSGCMPLHPQRPPTIPEATFTPTAAGFPVGEGHTGGQPFDFQSLVSQAITHLFQAGLQQTSYLIPSEVCASSICPASLAPPQPSAQAFGHLEEPLQDEVYLEDFELSDNEEMIPDKPTFPGLFRPSLFKSLLHKTKMATNMGQGLDQPSTSQSQPDPNGNLFLVSKPDYDFVPCPDLFSQVIQRPWEHPGSLPGPNSFDRKLYCSAPELDALLQVPSVDEPVASLTSSSVLVSEVGEGLKLEDKQAELAFRKTHQAASLLKN